MNKYSSNSSVPPQPRPLCYITVTPQSKVIFVPFLVMSISL